MRVLAALSGGVDSAVAAALAVQAGHEVTGVHMALSTDRAASRCSTRGCCTLEDSADAARTAAMLGIPFYVWDLAAGFEKTVIEDFVSEYALGRTPNPCVRCNEFVKFRELSDRARILGYDAVCTGHYARLIEGETGPELHRAKCLPKDQSYVLAVMGREELSRVYFPLGDFQSKAQVRQTAQDLGLPVSAKPDSYDICFIPDGDTAGFLRRRLGDTPGDIVDADGQVLGAHQGAYTYTIGQRKGLGLTVPAADGKPRYVIRTDVKSNRVVVGGAKDLTVTKILASDLVDLTDGMHAGLPQSGVGEEVFIQVRAHGEPVRARCERIDEGVQVIIVGTERGVRGMRGIAPGQSLVIYSHTRVIAQATVVGSEK